MPEARKRKYGWVRDLPDQRDLLFMAKPDFGPLPTRVDLREKCPPVENQQALGSCTACALAGILEYNEPKDSIFIDLSRLFIYYNERLIANSVMEDSGAQLRDGIKSLAKVGVCAESLWPYDITMFKRRPGKSCYKDAQKRRISIYQRLVMLNDMKSCLAQGYPFVFGFTVYESFESEEVAKTGVMAMPQSNERACGGHAVCAVGYDDGTEMIIVRNSWGEGWGQKGYFEMPYQYINNPSLASDMWMVRK